MQQTQSHHRFLEWGTLPFKKQKGKEKLRCPECDDIRTDKRDKSLVVNHDGGFGKCFYCSVLTFKDSGNDKAENDYKLPDQNWRNYTKLSDSLVKWLEEERKIPQSTAIELGWTEEKHYQPQHGKETNNLVFNYFEGDKVVNKKYRSGKKAFTQSAGTKSIFYNVNAIIGEEEVWVTEGEMDCASLHSVGIKNCISVPNGANDNDEPWRLCEPYFTDVKQFIIATDNDKKGIELREKIAQRLGRWRCEYIEWENKDANEDLVAGVLEKSVKNRQRFPVSGTFRVSDLMDGVMDLYSNGLPQTYYPKARCFGNLKRIYSTMRGQVNVATGIPSHGKSNITDWYVLNLVKDFSMKASWFSPEHSPMTLYQSNIMEKVIGKNFWKEKQGIPRMSKEEISQYAEWAEEKIYLTDAINGDFPTWDWLFDKFKEQMYAYGIDVFVIDAFNKVLLPKGNRLEKISEVLTKLTHFAQSNNVIVFLVAHPTKMRKNDDGLYATPTLYDVSGSADFRNMTHNGYTVYRYFEDIDKGTEDETHFINMKTKFNFQGKMNEKEIFKYCEVNGRFYAGEEPPYYNLITGENAESEIKPMPTADPQQAFALEDDLMDNSDIPF